MHLRLGDSGDPVKCLQRGLNRLGCMLLVDGDFGPQTCDAVTDARAMLGLPGPAEADDALQAAVAARPDPCPPLTAAGVTFIAREEISGPRAYRLKYKTPVWPSRDSGITIGIGYDLRFADPQQLQADWGDRLSTDAVARLATVLGRRGSPELLAAVRDVEVPLLAAMAVFIGRTLPCFLDATRSIYPQVDGLSPAQRTALVSLVYNRGTRLIDKNPVTQERSEMRSIRDLLAAGDVDAVPAQLDAMSRLWEGELPGLVQRRHHEALLFRSGFAALQLD